MKRCPACSRVYDNDDLRFCLDDGSNLIDRLADPPAPPTLAFPQDSPVPTIKQAFRPEVGPIPDAQGHLAVPPAPKERSILPWLLGIGALLLLGSSIVAAVMILRPRPSLVWHLMLEITPSTTNREAAVKQTVGVIESRLDALGISNFEVKPQGGSSGRILVSLPSLDDPERIKQIITDGGKLELTHVISPPSPAPARTYATKEDAIAALGSDGTVPSNRRVLPYVEREDPSSATVSRWVVVEAPAIVDGSELRNASATPSRGDKGSYDIQFSLRATGADKFGAWTGANTNKYIGVVLNDEVKSIAYIRGQIFDQGEITGRFTKQSAEDLALVLKSGALPAPLKIVEERIDK